MTNISEKQRKWIINDFKLPKIVTDSPYFETQYTLLKKYNFEYVFTMVEDLIDEFNGKSDLFFDEVNELSQILFDYIGKIYTDDYMTIIKSNLNLDNYHNSKALYNKTLINPDSINERYIRIDIKKACFNVLRLMTTKLDDHPTYEHLVHSFDTYDEQVREYVAQSKRIRAFIFGVIQKQLIIHLERHIMGDLLSSIDIDDLVFKDCDEIVYYYTDDNLKAVKDVISKSKWKSILRIETFHLNALTDGYIECHNGYEIFKGVPADKFCEQYAEYYNCNIMNDYKVFNYNGVPCLRLR